MLRTIEIRMAVAEDIPNLLEIYAPYVKNTAVTFEYDVPSVEEFTQRMNSVLKKYPYLVAILDQTIVGYAYASPFHSRAAYMWAAELSVYVHEKYHRLGIGRALYHEMERRLKKQNVTNLNACIAYPNPKSIAFHEKEGYHMVGHFSKCGYKLGRWWDMVWMEKIIGSHDIPPKPWKHYEPETNL